MITTDLQHTHPAGNVGLRGDARCPACRAEGRTLSEQQTHVVAELLDGLGRREDPADLVRVALIEAVLRGAEQQRIVDRRIVATLAEQADAEARSYSEVAADRLTRQEPDSAADAMVTAARSAERARTLRRVTL